MAIQDCKDRDAKRMALCNAEASQVAYVRFIALACLPLDDRSTLFDEIPVRTQAPLEEHNIEGKTEGSDSGTSVVDPIDC